MNKLGDTPVDLAGFCNDEECCMVFLRDLEKRMQERSSDIREDESLVIDFRHVDIESSRAKLTGN